MTPKRLAAAVVVVLSLAGSAMADETIVFLRHGEKPSGGYGQLTCQGFNRALALPRVLVPKFGKPNGLYAPNPSVKIQDAAGSFYYVRPLATIEPTGVLYTIGVNTRYAYTDVAGIESVLITSAKANYIAFVAWEHQYLVAIVQDLMNKYGGGVQVPAWVTGDYDSLYVVRVHYSSTGAITATFQHDYEGLNNLSTTCPY